jgi:propanol-preferring alcohol dehydrogenase
MLDAVIIFAPVGALVPLALRAVRPGGTLVCGGIHMSEIPSFPYHILWQERVLRSVANLTRNDAEEFLAFAALHSLQTRTTSYKLEHANEALSDLRDGRLTGAAVLVP